jgi:PEP-CTERM motif
MFTKSCCCLLALSSFCVSGLLSSATHAGVISFNLRSTGTGATAMALTEQAGALGVNHDNWNDVVASTMISGTTLAAGTIRDETGSILSGVAFSITRPSFPEQFKGVGTGTQRMFSSGFDIGPITNASDLKIALSGISYATYDVYVYSVGGDKSNNFAGRGGEVWLNGFQTGTRKSLRHLSSALNTSYVLANDSDAFDSSTAQGSYLMFGGQNGSSLTLDFEAGAGQRFPIAGIQIVRTSVMVPEPSTLTILGMGLFGLPVCCYRRFVRWD